MIRLSHWFVLVGVVAALGCLQVFQHGAVVSKGHRVGSQISAAHEKAIALSWMQTEVFRLSSPSRLAKEARQRKLKLVAWSLLEAPGAEEDTLIQLAAVPSLLPE